MARPRKPTHLKVVAGTAQPCRTNPHEPRPKVVRLAPPVGLSPRARQAWSKTTKLLHNMGVLTVADVIALQALCEAIADEWQARQALAAPITMLMPNPDHDPDDASQPALREVLIAAAQAPTYVTLGKSGAMIRMRPEVAAIADADRRVCMWLAKFGLTPADRSRVGAAPPEKNNPFDAF